MDIKNCSPILKFCLKIPNYLDLSSSCVDNKDFQLINAILLDFCGGLRSAIKEDKSFSMSVNEVHITTDLAGFSKGMFTFVLNVKVSGLVSDLTTIKQRVKEFVLLSMDMIVAERYYTRRTYSFVKSEHPVLLLVDNDGALSINASHKIISFIANKIQNALVKLYQLDRDAVIEVLIDNERIKIPGLEHSIQPTTKYKSDEPEQCAAILHNGNQASNNCNFQIRIGTSAPKSLTKVEAVDGEQLTKIRINARYENPVIVEIRHLTKELRGVRISNPDVEFVRLITNESARQLQLIPPEHND